jgi:hypothetical protein
VIRVYREKLEDKVRLALDRRPDVGKGAASVNSDQDRVLN